MLRALLLLIGVLVAAIAPAFAFTQDTATAIAQAALPGEVNFVSATTRDGGRTTEVEVVLTPAQDVRFRADGISVAFVSPDRRLVVTRVRGIGVAERQLMAGETKRGFVRFAVPVGYEWRILSGSLRWEYFPLHPIAHAAPQPLTIADAVSPGTPLPTAIPRPSVTPKPFKHGDVVAARCQSGSGEGGGLSRTERFDLATCLTLAGRDAQALHALRSLAHEIGHHYAGGVDRATFVQTWLSIAQLDGKHGQLLGAEHAAANAFENAVGSGLESQAKSAHRHYAALAQAARATPMPIVRRVPPADPVAAAVERAARGSSGSRAPPSSVGAGAMEEFSSDTAAHRHCPHDTVVWLNTNSGIYHYAGMRWYGNTNYGAYVCERAAIAAGNRATENGQ